MASERILGFVLAGGEGSRLRPLTLERAKPALGFAGGYRLIDFVLSNLVNSGVDPIYVLAQYKPSSIVEHVAAVWGPRIRPLLPARPEGYSGTATAVQQNMSVIERAAPDLVAVFAADHVYRMDVRQMAAFHRVRRAQVSVAAVAVPIESARAFGVIVTGSEGRVLQFQEKPRRPRPLPDHPDRAYASMGNYLFDPGVLAQALGEMQRRGGKDFGHDVLPCLPGAIACSPTTSPRTCCPASVPTRSPPTGATSEPCARCLPHARTSRARARASSCATRAGRSAAGRIRNTTPPRLRRDARPSVNSAVWATILKSRCGC